MPLSLLQVTRQLRAARSRTRAHNRGTPASKAVGMGVKKNAQLSQNYCRALRQYQETLEGPLRIFGEAVVHP
jgi:hypothetical protein